MKKVKVQSNDDIINIDCPHCDNWEQMGVDDPRHHLNSLPIVKWLENEVLIAYGYAKHEESVHECNSCKTKFVVEWDYDNPIIKATEENNKKIAEFMGYETYEGVDKVCINLTENNGFSSDWGHVPTKYHTSWDWLMPVVEKIKDMGYDQELDKIDNVLTCNLRKENLYNAVIEFINLKNKS